MPNAFVEMATVNAGGGIQPNGPIGNKLAGVQWDSGVLRPFRDDDDVLCVDVLTGNTKWNDEAGQYDQEIETMPVASYIRNGGSPQPIYNANTALRKIEWEYIDRQVLRAFRARLRAWTDLLARGSVGGFNAMAKTVYEYEKMSDPGEAMVGMNVTTPGRNDQQLYQLAGLPLPITYSDFGFDDRRLAISRNFGDTALNSVLPEAATHRVAETVEQTVIGSITGMNFGGYQVYGYTNFPDRVTYSGTPALPIPDGTNGHTIVQAVLGMINTAYDNHRYGPFMLYHSTDWDNWLGDDYYISGGNNPSQTLKARLQAIDGITDVRRLDYFTDAYELLLIDMNPETAQAINGMGITTVQWDSMGGLQHNFKVMCIQVPLLRSDFNGNCGIIHAIAA